MCGEATRTHNGVGCCVRGTAYGNLVRDTPRLHEGDLAFPQGERIAAVVVHEDSIAGAQGIPFEGQHDVPARVGSGDTNPLGGSRIARQGGHAHHSRTSR